MAKKKGSHVGGIVFLVGLVLAIILSIFTATNVPGWALLVLAVMGIIAGLLNIKKDEVNKFLISSIAFLISFSALGAVLTTLALGWVAIGTFFSLLAVFVAPATAVVAVVSLFNLTKD